MWSACYWEADWGKNCEQNVILAKGPEADSTLPLPFWALCFASVFGFDALSLISLIEKSQCLNWMDGADRCIPWEKCHSEWSEILLRLSEDVAVWWIRHTRKVWGCPSMLGPWSAQALSIILRHRKFAFDLWSIRTQWVSRSRVYIRTNLLPNSGLFSLPLVPSFGSFRDI